MAAKRLTLRTAIIGVAAIALVGIGLATLLRPPADPTTARTAVGEADAVPVTLAEVRLGDRLMHHRTDGTIVAAEDMPIPSPLDSAIGTIEVADGDRVEAGDVIVRLQQTAEAAAVMSAEARVEQAEDVLARAREMDETDIGLTQDIATLEADVERVKERLETAREALELRTVRAPFAGEVRLMEDLGIGALVMRGQPLATLSAEERLLARFELPRELMPAATPGTTVEVVGADGATAEAVIEAEAGGQQAQVATQLTIEASLDEEARGFAVDDVVAVRLPVERVDPRPVIPAEALAAGPTGAVVYRVVDGIARRVPVQTGASSDVGVEITGALQPGDRVVVEGLDAVTDGTPVHETGD